VLPRRPRPGRRCRGWPGWTAAGLAACLVGSGSARADEPPRALPLSFAWSAPEGCPAAAEVAAQIRSTIGAAEVVSGPIRAAAVAAREGAGWRADVSLTVGDQAGGRHVEGETCRAVADAVALIVALAVSPAPERLPSPPPAPPRAAPPAQSHALIGVAGALDVGGVPSVGLGGEAFGAWTAGRFEVGLVGTWIASETATLTSNPSQGAHVWLVDGTLRGCCDVLTSGLRLAPCVGGGLRKLVGEGFGATPSWDANDYVGVVFAGARGVVPLSGHLGLRLGADVVVPMTRPIFVIENGGAVFRSSVAALRATLGVQVQF
jgi:hypothetical protein